MGSVSTWVTLARVPVFTDYRKGGTDMGEDALNWRISHRAITRFTKDIAIQPWEMKQARGIRITFVKPRWLQFAINGKVTIAQHGHRIYFKGDVRGFTLYKMGSRYHIRVAGDDLYEFAKRYAGCYTLHQDTPDGFRYIDVYTEDRDIV